MKVDLRLSPETFGIITDVLQPLYNTKAVTRRDKTTLSIALDVVTKLDSKCNSIKAKMNLFDAKKKIKITFKHHEADMLELLLFQQIKKVTDSYIEQKIQETINELNQKLA
ncbi:hypothetical protein [Flavobacterium oreochromis]|uniref:Uncharacterized protein n=1 Tax=Flavobacterium columnare TaxID=996 RepID=A0A246GAB2_9FLAO|nr:hypothetical protein [Flavobacterium oreochromis]OWP76860.1 hypothetical protein BWK62_08715 [Flavobacterium oreochromis]